MGVVAQEHGFGQLADGGLLVGVEAPGSFEREADFVAGPALVVVETSESVPTGSATAGARKTSRAGWLLPAP